MRATDVGRLALAGLAAVALTLAATGHAAAEPGDGTVSGTLRNGTPGGGPPEGAHVILIALDATGVVDSQEMDVDAEGRFAFPIDPAAGLTYIVHAVFDDVRYFAEPVNATPAEPSAVRDLTVFESTTTMPALTADAVTLTLVGIDRAAGVLTLLREDLVRNPDARVFVAGPGGATLSIPAPEQAVDAMGIDPFPETVSLQGGVALSTGDLSPGLTAVPSRIDVRYDLERDEYRLRVTSSLDAGVVSVRIPERFLRSARLVGEGQRAENVEIEGETLLVFERADVRAGQGVVVDLVGLSGLEFQSNPLTEIPGAYAAAGLALAVLVAVALAIGRAAGMRRGPAAPPEAP